MATRKKNVDKQPFPEGTTPEQELASSGLAGTPINEPIPEFIKADNEKVIQGANNTYIVLGRDRPSHLGSGYGGKGHTNAGSIDLVVGREGKEEEYVNNDFETDAARIHISQKTDIDENFSIVDGASGPAIESSAVGIKADYVRLVGRKGIKIVTNTDDKDSFGFPVDTQNGIELIANNDESDLQPIPLGDNLEGAILQLHGLVKDLSGIVGAFAEQQHKYDIILSTHVHNAPFFGIPVLPSPTCVTQGNICQTRIATDVIAALAKFTVNLKNYEETYLGSNPLFPIKSSNNKVN